MFDQSVPGSKVKQLEIAVGIELLPDQRQVIEDGLGVQMHGAGNVGRGVAMSQHAQHLEFARGQVL